MATRGAPTQPTFDQWKWGPGNPISESAWMICGGLANTTHNLLSYLLQHALQQLEALGIVHDEGQTPFDGYPASNVWTMALPDNIEEWLENTGCYTSVVNSIDVADKLLSQNNKTLANDSRITGDFTDKVDIILCVNAHLFTKGMVTPAVDAPSSPVPVGIPDHYKMLCKPVTLKDNVVTINIWTWGGYYEIKGTLQDFNENYFGSIIGYASSPRRTLNVTPLTTNAIRNQRIYFGPDHVLHSADIRAEWFELHRIGAGPIPNPVGNGQMMTARDILQRVWPDTAINQYAVDLGKTYWYDPEDTLYEIVACHSALKPYDCDPFSYNHYDDVQCNHIQCNIKQACGGYQCDFFFAKAKLATFTFITTRSITAGARSEI
jgi:hypothetical protein